MKESKVVSSLREAIRLSGLQDGMCVSFHHHLRNGDYVVNMVMEQISAMGIRDLTVNASALFDVHLPMLEHIKNGTVSRLLTNYMSAGLGRAISGGVMDQPVEFRTHGGRPRDIAGGETPIDVAFIAAPSSDTMGNCTGKVGKSACGSLGYAFPDAQYAKRSLLSPTSWCRIRSAAGRSRKFTWIMSSPWTPSVTPPESSPARPA